MCVSQRNIRPREDRWGPAEICQNLSVPIVSHMQDWSSMNSIVTPAVRRGFWAAFRDFNWEVCSRFLIVCTDTRLP